MIKVIKLRKIIILFIIIFFVIFFIFYYKNIFSGNNIIKNRVEKNIQKLKYYNANLEVEIISNKSIRKYSIYQEVTENKSIQKVKNGDELVGLEIEYDGNDLILKNDKYDLEKIYLNYNDLVNNSLFLNTFVNDFQNDNNERVINEENENIVIDVKLNNSKNTYIQNKILYIDKNTLLPIMMEIKDCTTHNKIISIKYNNIEIK